MVSDGRPGRRSGSQGRPARRGRSGGLAPGIGVVFKIDGADTGGALSIVEHPFAVGALVPPHVHTLEDEYSIVLEGEIGFRSEDREVVLGVGGYIVKPRGEVHAMWNAGRTQARMIEIITPAGFERFFAELTEMTADRTAAPCRSPGARPAVRAAVRRACLAAGRHRALRAHADCRERDFGLMTFDGACGTLATGPALSPQCRAVSRPRRASRDETVARQRSGRRAVTGRLIDRPASPRPEAR